MSIVEELKSPELSRFEKLQTATEEELDEMRDAVAIAVYSAEDALGEVLGKYEERLKEIKNLFYAKLADQKK